jgi:tetratricopeptide (TPR) repeat protein
VLRERFPERVEGEPELVARHAEAAGRIDDAIRYYDLAGRRAQSRSAHEEAITQFEEAIVLVEQHLTDAEQHARAAALNIALGASLVAARGYGHPDTAAAYQHAAASAEAAGDAAQVALARGALGMLFINNGEVERGYALSREMAPAVGTNTPPLHAMVLYANLMNAEHYQGRFASSLDHAERSIAICQSLSREETFWGGAYQLVPSQCWASWNLLILGRPDMALSRAREAVSMARHMGHPFSLAMSLFFETVVHLYRGDPDAQAHCAMQGWALAEEHGFPFWKALGLVYGGAARVAKGDVAALADMTDGLALASETARAGAPGVLFILADAQRGAGHVADSQATVDMALAIAVETGQRFFNSPLNRLAGELLMATGSVAEAAERFGLAIEIAREQEARFFELRAATSLARLWRDQGKRAEARDLLAPVYAWFTEGFDTRDLIEAKALLDELR